MRCNQNTVIVDPLVVLAPYRYGCLFALTIACLT